MNRTIYGLRETLEKEIEIDEEILHDTIWTKDNHDLLLRTIKRIEEEKSALKYTKFYIRGLI